MPRDPIDISITSPQRSARKFGEFDDAKDPIRLRIGSGPAGAEGKEGKEGPAGAEGKEGKEGPAGSGRKSTVGEATAEFKEAEENSKVATIEHKLGSKPSHINISVEKAEGNVMFTHRIIERTSTVFKVQINAETAPKENIKFTWEALA
jgi:hypothetical protein